MRSRGDQMRAIRQRRTGISEVEKVIRAVDKPQAFKETLALLFNEDFDTICACRTGDTTAKGLECQTRIAIGQTVSCCS